MKHSNIVGGSTAKRVINCPGSVALVRQIPAQPSSHYADVGTLLHDCIAKMIDVGVSAQSLLGTKYNNVELTQDLIDDKLLPAFAALDVIDPNVLMDIKVEARVAFDGLLPNVFGSADVLGRIGERGYVIDWKFGDGVAVEAIENEQLMFYAAGGMRTYPEFFQGVTELELIIVQPPAIKRWVTTPERIALFERSLVHAVATSELVDSPLSAGDHCRWCPAKPICPQMNGAAERSLQTQINQLDANQIGDFLTIADSLEGWISDLRSLAQQMLESGVEVPGYKLVAKRATRQWVSEEKAVVALLELGLAPTDCHKTELLSPAQMEKVLKKRKMALPDDLVVAVSSGDTIAPESDPRPARVFLPEQIKTALSKLG